jgi:putative ABC transport system substrate-binding protein
MSVINPTPWLRTSRLRLSLSLLLAGMCTSALAASANQFQATAPATRLAVIYSSDDERTPGEYSEIIRAIKAMPSVLVVPINLANNDLLAEASPARWQLANKIAQASGEGGIAVVYPDIGEPYRSVFTKMIEGIEAKTRKQVLRLAIGNHQNSDELRNTLKNRDVRVVIALGRQGLLAADSLGNDFGVVVGGVTAVPESDARRLSVISLTPDPALLFARLKNLVPDSRRVFVVYDPRQNGWLLRLAKVAARNQGLELVAYEAQDLKTAVAHYQQILASADPGRDSLWLPQDSTTVEDSAVLPLVLQSAWNNSLPVFSSSFAHVKRGILFSLYPDNLGLGQNLASSAIELLNTGEATNPGMAPLKDVQTAVNLRTARHLGLNISAREQRSFGAVFADQ